MGEHPCDCGYEAVDDGGVTRYRYFHDPGCPLAPPIYDPQSELYERFVTQGETPDPLSAKRLYPGLPVEEALARIARLAEAARAADDDSPYATQGSVSDTEKRPA